MTKPKIPWVRKDAGWRADMPGEVTLFAVPDRTKGLFGEKPARGTTWRAGVSRWDGATSTISSFGRDAYRETCADAKAAKALAESIYAEALGQ